MICFCRMPASGATAGQTSVSWHSTTIYLPGLTMPARGSWPDSGNAPARTRETQFFRSLTKSCFMHKKRRNLKNKETAPAWYWKAFKKWPSNEKWVRVRSKFTPRWQDLNITEQLDFGIRFLDIDTIYRYRSVQYPGYIYSNNEPKNVCRVKGPPNGVISSPFFSQDPEVYVVFL